MKMRLSQSEVQQAIRTYVQGQIASGLRAGTVEILIDSKGSDPPHGSSYLGDVIADCEIEIGKTD